MRRQLFAVLPLVALSSLLSWLTVEAVNVRAICENGDLDESLMNFCKSLDSFYSPANDLYQWDDDVTDDDGYVFGSSRSRRDASFMPGLRSRRGGNYIRFGRSITDLSDDPSVRRTLLASFGAPARRTSSGHYMRFGRSVDHVTDSQAAEKRFGGENGKDEDEHGNFVRLARPFMRFGRSGRDEEGDAKRAFMRFGRSHLEDDADVKRAFMRFGRAFYSGANSDDDNAMLGEIPDKKAFMRFGKRAFMRFGRRTAEDGNEKRFMRFGRKSDDDDDDDVEDGYPDKRFMRFGKRAFMRFGRGSDDELAGDEMESASKRAFMRFGKRSGTAEDDDDVREKKFMRFGRNGGESEDETGKRFMRFGRNDRTSDASADKRFMRFGKRQQQQQHEETDSARS